MNAKAVAIFSKAVAVTSIVSSAASILGFIALALPAQPKWEDWMFTVTYAIFAGALILSLYTILVPGNPLLKNVKSKLVELPSGARFARDHHPTAGDLILTQTGVVSGGLGASVVRFPTPFVETPVFTLACAEQAYVSTVEVTADFARVEINSTGVGRIEWFARGKPLHFVNVYEIEPVPSDGATTK